MKRVLAVLCVLLLAGAFGAASFATLAQDKQEPAKKEAPHAVPTDIKIPEAEAKRENSIKPTNESVATGKRLFTTQCAMCHGADGDGKGELAEPLKLTLRDWRDPATLKDLSDGALFYILTKGKDKMPGQEGRMKADQQWHLVNYVRSLAKKEKTPVEKPK